MGIIAERQKKRRAAQSRKSMMRFAAVAGMLALAVCASPIAERAERFFTGVQVFSHGEQQEFMLPEYDVYALQLAVFDNGERAATEAKRLQQLGVRCVIWQRERMRIVADAALSRGDLNPDAAKGYEAYVIRETLEEIRVRLSADAFSIAQALQLLKLPDDVLKMILQKEKSLSEITAQVKTLAEQELETHPENELYTQLTQSLMNWAVLMEKTLKETDEDTARSYAAVTMCTLCRQLRQALSALSTASAQRTPSTAADVMPPA